MLINKYLTAIFQYERGRIIQCAVISQTTAWTSMGIGYQSRTKSKSHSSNHVYMKTNTDTKHLQYVISIGSKATLYSGKLRYEKQDALRHE